MGTQRKKRSLLTSGRKGQQRLPEAKAFHLAQAIKDGQDLGQGKRIILQAVEPKMERHNSKFNGKGVK